MKKKGDYIVDDGTNVLKLLFWILFGIMGFCVCFFPLFGQNLRYQIGHGASGIFNTVGTILMTIGVLLLVWGVLTLFCGKSMGGVKTMLLGVMFCYLAMFFINPSTIGASSGKEVPRGYH